MFHYEQYFCLSLKKLHTAVRELQLWENYKDRLSVYVVVSTCEYVIRQIDYITFTGKRLVSLSLQDNTPTPSRKYGSWNVILKGQ